MNARGAARRESAEELQRLRDQRRINLQPGEDLWVFGYGSLMWRPGFPHLEVRLARLFGYHRRFCIFSHHHRGTPEVPGLIFGLDRRYGALGRRSLTAVAPSASASLRWPASAKRLVS